MAPDGDDCRGGRLGPRELAAGGRTAPMVKTQDPWEVATGAAGRLWARRDAWGISHRRAGDPRGGTREGP
jgi:hypothetical protein